MIEHFRLSQQLHHDLDIISTQHQLSIVTVFPFVHCSGSPSAQRGIPEKKNLHPSGGP
jgi:hypothetical protein